MLSRYKNLRLRWKIVISPLFLTLVLACVGAFAIHVQRTSQTGVDALMSGPVRQAEVVSDFGTSAWTTQVQLYRLMATAANETDTKKIAQLGKAATAALADLSDKLKALDALNFNEVRAQNQFGKLKAATAKYIKQANGVVDMAQSDAGSALMLMMGAGRSFNELAGDADDLNDSAKDTRDRKIALNDMWLERQGSVLIGITALGVLLGCAASFFIGLGISRPIVGITKAVQRMGEGDFETVLPGLDRRDEIGDIAVAVEAIKSKAIEKAQREAEDAAQRQAQAAQEAARPQHIEADLQAKANHERAQLAEAQARVLSLLAGGLKRLSEGDLTVALDDGFSGDYRQIKEDFNAAVSRLQATIGSISEAAREVSNATGEIASSTTDLSQRTEEQAASLEQTSASMEELAGTVKRNAESAERASQSAGATCGLADRSGAVVAQAVEAMTRIEHSSRRISDIIGVIDEIARQTNLLALNAAVEAARAGEAGRGFAVVASEVRSLAQRSSQAAKDITALITESGGQVKEGADLVHRAGEALHEIVGSIKAVADVMAEIASASSEQAIGIEQVNRALGQMDEMTQQNSALVEQNAATAKMLEQQAHAMDESVSFFRLQKQTVAATRRSAAA